MESLLIRCVRHFRARRMRRFVRELSVTPDSTILDVGGTTLNWSLLPFRPRVVLLNTTREQRPEPGWTFVAGDGRSLPFRGRSFDIVFSNSVIEHVGERAEQRRFAAEVARVGRRYWIQTPDRGFPVEPHLLTPFLHFLPARAQAWIARRLTVWALLVRPTPDRWQFYIEHYLRDIRLLSSRELEELFPQAQIHHERFLGMSKSLIAVTGGHHRSNASSK